MPKVVMNNVAGLRVLHEGRVLEDVTSVSLPDIENETTDITGAGMVATVTMPDMTRFKAMETSVAHNNGENCKYLQQPGKRVLEVRTARQRYNVAQADIGHQADRYRMTVVHTGTSKGQVELGNPYGSTDKFSILRYEETQNGSVITLIDVMAGIIKINGVDYTNVIENLLR